MSTRTIVRRGLTGVAATALAAGATLAAVGGTSAADAAVPHHGKIYFVIGSSGKSATVLLHGTLNAIGTDPDNSSDNYDVLHFPGGTLRVNHPQKTSKYKPYENKKTCYASFTESGTGTFDHGTGKYKGVHGTLSYSSSASFFLARAKSGACDEDATPRAEIFTVHASGTLK